MEFCRFINIKFYLKDLTQQSLAIEFVIRTVYHRHDHSNVWYGSRVVTLLEGMADSDQTFVNQIQSRTSPQYSHN